MEKKNQTNICANNFHINKNVQQETFEFPSTTNWNQFSLSKRSCWFCFCATQSWCVLMSNAFLSRRIRTANLSPWFRTSECRNSCFHQQNINYITIHKIVLLLLLGAPFVRFWNTNLYSFHAPWVDMYTIFFSFYNIPKHNGLTHWWLFEKHSAILCIRNQIEHRHSKTATDTHTDKSNDCARIKKLLSIFFFFFFCLCFFINVILWWSRDLYFFFIISRD